MRARSHRLADALAVRLGPVLPDGYRIQAQTGQVSIFRGSVLIGTVAATAIADDSDDRATGERIGVAIRAALSAVQDCIVESLGKPWPLSRTTEMALPHAYADGERVRAWFGDELAPVLVLPSMQLEEIESAQ